MSLGLFATAAPAGAVDVAAPLPLEKPAERVEIARTPLNANRRIETIDAARFIAVICVIFIHSVESKSLAPYAMFVSFSVPFYLFASLYFQARSFRRNPDRSLCHYILGRCTRLFVPFLAWTAIYLVARNVKRMFLVGEDPVPMEYWYFWVGTASHLWFLPVLLTVTILFAVVNRACAKSRVVRWIVLLTASMVGAYLAVAERPGWLDHVDGEGYFFLQAWKALPSIFLGLALAWAATVLDKRMIVSRVIGVMGVLLTLTMVILQMRYGYSRLDRTISGMGWMIAAMAAWRGKWVAVLAKLGRYSFGIYLAHALVIESVQAIAHRAGVGSSIGFDIFTTFMGVVGGLAIARFIDRHKRLAWLNG